MISLDSIAAFFPEPLRRPPIRKHLLKEWVECLALKRRDVEHLLFRRETASRITDFPLFLQTL